MGVSFFIVCGSILIRLSLAGVGSPKEYWLMYSSWKDCFPSGLPAMDLLMIRSFGRLSGTRR